MFDEEQEQLVYSVQQLDGATMKPFFRLRNAAAKLELANLGRGGDHATPGRVAYWEREVVRSAKEVEVAVAAFLCRYSECECGAILPCQFIASGHYPARHATHEEMVVE